MATRPVAALLTLSSNRACSLTGTGRPESPHFALFPGLQAREEGGHYLPDLSGRADDEEYEADPELPDAACRYLDTNYNVVTLDERSKILIVCHCYREDDGLIRIISAREADKSEHRQYSEYLR